jgi:hypothetical protein
MTIRILRTAAGVVLGYAFMVVLITLVQETWFGGVSLNKSSIGVLVAAGLLTSLAAAVGSVTATSIARPFGRIAAIVMAGAVVLETTVLVATGRVSGPLWFDLVAAGSLIVSILVGAEVLLRARLSRPAA